MSCEPERVTGYVDGVLDAAATAEVEAHLVDCASCREQVEFERGLRRRLRALAPLETPISLESQVRHSLRRPGRSRSWFWGLPVAASLLMFFLWGRGHAAVVAWQLARDHDHCFGRPKLPAKVWSSDPLLVSRWFENEGTVLPAVPESAHGLELVGGRFCPLIDRSVAHVYYAGEDDQFSLYLVPGSVRFDGFRIGSARGHTVGLLRVGRRTVGLVGKDAERVEAFRHALATIVALAPFDLPNAP